MSHSESGTSSGILRDCLRRNISFAVPVFVLGRREVVVGIGG